MSDNRKISIHHYSLKPIAVALRPSRLLTLVLGAVGLGAMALVWTMPLPVALQALLMLAIVASAGDAVWRYAWLRAPQSIQQLEVNHKGALRCLMPAHDWQAAQVLGSSTVTPWLTVLNLRLEGRRFARHVVLLPDMAEHDTLRQLRVWLRWGQTHA